MKELTIHSPKGNEQFEPDLASTQIIEYDDEINEFEAVSKAEENDYNEDGLSFQMSDETVARLGNNTLFDFQNIENANKKLSNQFYRQI